MRTVWFGPVAPFQVGAAAGDPFFQCTGDGSDGKASCSERAASAGGLSAIARGYGIADDEPLALRGFSAGGQVIKRLLVDPVERGRVAVVQLADGTYETEPSVVAEGFAVAGAEAARGERIFVATASSSPNKDHPNGAQVLDALRQEIERRVGQPFAEVTLPWAPKPPRHAWRLGHALLVDWGDAYGHGEHATVLAPIVWREAIEPWLTSAEDTESPPIDRPLLGLGLGLILAGVAVASAAAVLLRREQQPLLQKGWEST